MIVLRAACYVRGQHVFIQPMSRTRTGIWIGSDPCQMLSVECSTDELGAAVLKALRDSKDGVPQPSNWDDVARPLLDLAGVGSWGSFSRGSRLVSISQQDTIAVKPRRRRGRGYDPIEDMVRTLPADAPAMLLGEAVRWAIEVSVG